MDNISIAKRVLPHLNIEAEGNDIIIDVFLRIESIRMMSNLSLFGGKEVDGFRLTACGVVELAEKQSFADVLVEAVKFHAVWTVLERIGDDEYAEQLVLERTPEWQDEIAKAIGEK